jgi:lipoprotein-anchoring transpeptidase ErfK/SrfK
MAFHGGRGDAAGTAGCFRMADADVVRLARIVRAGTPVIIVR